MAFYKDIFLCDFGKYKKPPMLVGGFLALLTSGVAGSA